MSCLQLPAPLVMPHLSSLNVQLRKLFGNARRKENPMSHNELMYVFQLMVGDHHDHHHHRHHHHHHHHQHHYHHHSFPDDYHAMSMLFLLYLYQHEWSSASQSCFSSVSTTTSRRHVLSTACRRPIPVHLHTIVLFAFIITSTNTGLDSPTPRNPSYNSSRKIII